MITITVKRVLAHGPCEDYTEKRLREALGDGKTPLEVAQMYWVDPVDLLWLLLRTDYIPEPWMHLLACDFAEECLRRERSEGREPDERSWKALEVKRAWVRGEATDDELSAASAAASAAAGAAAGAAARAARAARAAAWAAAWAAARAARDTAWAAARAARAAAWAAASQWQIARVAEVLRVLENKEVAS